MTLSKKTFSNWDYSLGLIIDSTYNGVIAVDKDGYIVVLNEPARSMLNLKEDAAGRHILEVLPECSLPAVLRSGTAEIGRKIILEDRICLANMTPIMKEDKVVGAVAVFEDITLMQNLIEEMSSVKELRCILDSVLENANEGIVIVDKSGSITMCNDIFCNFIKTRKNRAIGENIADILPELGLMSVLETGEQEFAEPKHVRGCDVIVTSAPILTGQAITGAVCRITFKHTYESDPMFHKVNILRNKLAFYKEQLEKVSGAKYTIDNIVGKSQIISQLKETLKKVAPGNSTVLLRGEPGTGKELFAHVLHLESPRKYGPFVKVSCSAVPENLLEMELFGLAKGNAAGKKGPQVGKFELADQGTIFIDEIAELSPEMQGKLLRILQEKAIRRVGDDTPIPVDVRIIASTKRNLEDLIRAKKFRADLYYRLNVLSFYIPPIRERREDIEPLINFIIDKFNREFGKKVIGISSEVYKIIMKYNWPGNVSELENVFERAFSVIEDQVIQPHHLPAYLTKKTNAKTKAGEITSLKTVLEDAERNALIQALQRTGGNKVKAAKLLKISRAGLYQKLEKYNLLDD